MAAPAAPDTVAVVGNSLIGHGIAQVFAAAGHRVVMIGRDLPSGRGVYDWSRRDGAVLLKEREEELFRHLARDRAARG